MSNQNSTQNTRLTIVINDGQQLEDFQWGRDFTEIEDEIVEEWRHGNIKRKIMRRDSDNRYFSLEYRTGPDGTGFRDNNDFPLEAYEVYPKQITITVYE